MYLEIVTPDRKAFEGEIKSVKVPGSEGAFEMLNNHAALISNLGKGEVSIRTASNELRSFNIDGGVVEVLNNKVIILAESITA